MAKRKTEKSPKVDIFDRTSRMADMLKNATGDPPPAPVEETPPPPAAPKIPRQDKAPAKPKKKALEVLPGGSKAPQPEPVAEQPLEQNVLFRVRIPQGLKTEWATFKAELSAALGGVVLDDANVGRPILELILVEFRERILEQAGELKGTLKRPSNKDRVAMAEMDAALKDAILKGLKQRKRK